MTRLPYTDFLQYFRHARESFATFVLHAARWMQWVRNPRTVRACIAIVCLVLVCEVGIGNLGVWLSPTSSQTRLINVVDVAGLPAEQSAEQTTTSGTTTSTSPTSTSSSSPSSLTSAGVSSYSLNRAHYDSTTDSIVLDEFGASITLRFNQEFDLRTVDFTFATPTSEHTSAHASEHTIQHNTQTTIQTDPYRGVRSVQVNGTDISFMPSVVHSGFSFITQNHSVATPLAMFAPPVHTRDVQIAFSQTPGTSIPLQSILLNARKPFTWSWLRVAVIVSIALLVIALRPRSQLYRITLDTSSTAQKFAFWLFVAAPICALTAYTLRSRGVIAGPDTFYTPGNYIYSYQQYSLAAQAIMENHPWVNLPVDPLFEALPNPYSPALRDEILRQGASIYWDFAFFNHRWYSYFGILPVLLIYIPFYSVTSWFNAGVGYMPSTSAVVVTLLGITAIVASAALIRFIARFLPEASVGHTIIALATMLTGSHIIALYLVPNIYAVAISSAMCLVAIGLWLWMGAIRTVDITLQHKSYVKIALGSLCLGLSLACRPTFVFSACVAFPLLCILLVRVLRSPRTSDFSSRPENAHTPAFVSPYAAARIIATTIISGLAGFAPALWYNYWRFGNLFDFGSTYQITVTDLTHLKPTVQSVSQTMWYYMAAPIQLTATFPYVSSPFTPIHPWIHREHIISGIFVSTPLLAIVVASCVPYVLRQLRRRRLLMLTSLSLVTGILVCAITSYAGGLAWRYFNDFAWMLVLAAIPAIMIVLQWAHAHVDKFYGRMVTWIVAACVIYSVAVMAITFIHPNRLNTLTIEAPELYYQLRWALTI